MTDTAPDPAVQIVARKLNHLGTERGRANAERVVTALRREYEFCPPGTLAEVAALRRRVAELMTSAQPAPRRTDR